MAMRALIVRRPTTFDRVDRVKRVVGEPVLVGDDRLWILGETMEIFVNTPEAHTVITIPAGFVTDGASVPYLAQVLTGWKPWDEPQRWAAIAHDWLYCDPKCFKSTADRIFRAVLVAEGSSRFRAWIMYLAVKFFGGQAYREDQRIGPTVRA